MNDLISVIVPVYKVEKYLDRCVASIVNQTYKNLEIILVDDGSPDNCPQMCDEWTKKDSRIKVIHKQNGGVSLARNAGLDVTEGKYVCFVDSDDEVESNCVEELYKPMLEKNYDLVFGNVNDVYGNLIRKRIKLNSQLLTDDFRKNCRCLYRVLRGIWAKLYRVDMIKEHNICFPDNVSYGEDHWFNIEYYRAVKSFKFVNKVLYNYWHRPNQDSLSSYFHKKYYWDIVRRLLLQRDFYLKCEVENYGYILNEDVFPALLASVSYGERDGYDVFVNKVREVAVFFDYTCKCSGFKQFVCMKMVQCGVYWPIYVWGRYLRKWYFYFRNGWWKEII